MRVHAAFSGLVGVVVALLTARLRADYLAIVTLGFSETVRLVASNELWIANGTDGISGVPGPYRGVLTPQQFNLLYLVIVGGQPLRGSALEAEQLRAEALDLLVEGRAARRRHRRLVGERGA